jgi:hypothetical protein
LRFGPGTLIDQPPPAGLEPVAQHGQEPPGEFVAQYDRLAQAQRLDDHPAVPGDVQVEGDRPGPDQPDAAAYPPSSNSRYLADSCTSDAAGARSLTSFIELGGSGGR